MVSKQEVCILFLPFSFLLFSSSFWPQAQIFPWRYFLVQKAALGQMSRWLHLVCAATHSRHAVFTLWCLCSHCSLCLECPSHISIPTFRNFTFPVKTGSYLRTFHDFDTCKNKPSFYIYTHSPRYLQGPLLWLTMTVPCPGACLSPLWGRQQPNPACLWMPSKQTNYI